MNVSNDPHIGLLDLLLLGAPEGKTELIDGRVLRVVPIHSPAHGRLLFLDIARDLSVLASTSFEDERALGDSESFDAGRAHLRLLADRVEFEMEVSLDLWRAFTF